MTADSLTENDLRALGMDPLAPFATCPRTADAPFDVRFGDDRIVRRIDGGVVCHIGYYSESQERSRRLAGELLFGRFKASSMFMRFMER